MIEFSQVKNKEELQILKGKTAKYEDLSFAFSDERIAEMEELLGEDNAYQLFARDEDGNMAGYIAGAKTIHHEYFTINELFVDPKFQGQRVGTNLLKQIFKFAENNNLKGVITQTEFENIPAQKLYEKVGFLKIDNPGWTNGVTYELLFN